MNAFSTNSYQIYVGHTEDQSGLCCVFFDTCVVL
jgi:hypothetical protein